MKTTDVNNMNWSQIKIFLNRKTSKFLVITLVLLSVGTTLVSSTNYKTLLSARAQSIATVSMVKEASNPTTPNPYNPSPLKVKAGTTVTWTNNDSTLHTVSSGLPEQGAVGTLFDSSLIAPGKTYTHTFDKPGTFDYSCTLHPFMHGQVIVK